MDISLLLVLLMSFVFVGGCGTSTGEDGPDKLVGSDAADSIDAEPADDATDPADPRLVHPRLLKAFEIFCEVVKFWLSKLLDRDDRTTRMED
jgi:hypothetical protein